MWHDITTINILILLDTRRDIDKVCEYLAMCWYSVPQDMASLMSTVVYRTCWLTYLLVLNFHDDMTDTILFQWTQIQQLSIGKINNSNSDGTFCPKKLIALQCTKRMVRIGKPQFIHNTGKGPVQRKSLQSMHHWYHSSWCIGYPISPIEPLDFPKTFGCVLKKQKNLWLLLDNFTEIPMLTHFT